MKKEIEEIKITSLSELAYKILDKDGLAYLKTKIKQKAKLNPFDNLIQCDDLRYIDPAYLEFKFIKHEIL